MLLSLETDKISGHNNHGVVRKRRLTSGDGNHHRLLLFGLAPPTAGPTGVADDRALAAALTARGAHHERTRAHRLLHGMKTRVFRKGRSGRDRGWRVGWGCPLTMPEPLQAGQRCTLLPGS